MIIFLGKDSVYKINDDFPIFSIPVDMEGATTQSLSDFQWWAFSSDFEKWLKENPREWTADSEDMSKYGSPIDFIKESLREQYLANGTQDGVLDFDTFHENPLFEEEGDESSKDAIKFLYAYNKLLSENKIQKEFVTSAQKQGAEKAVFVTLDDPESKQEIAETLSAFKMTALPVSSNSKMALFKISETLPGGPIKDEESSETLVKRVADSAIKVGGLGLVGLGLYQVISVVGGIFMFRKASRYLDRLLPAARVTDEAKKSSAIIKALTKGKDATKGLIGRRLNPLKFGKGIGEAGKFWKTVGTSLTRGASGAYKAVTKGKQGISTAMKAFGKGATRGLGKLGAKGAVDWIPVVGWTLAAIDVVGSTWNWFSNKQAPRYGEVESFAKDKFVAKSIPIGVPITICWSQEAGGTWGTVMNFIANNDTRTTMELVKVADINGKSVFILTQIHSKELGKQLAENELTLVAFDSSEEVETGILDNDDLDFELLAISGLSNIASIFNFKGVCDWNDLMTNYDSSSNRLFIADDTAPPKYNFYFEDKDGEEINVSGDLISSDELSKISDADLAKYMGYPESSQGKGKNESLDSDFIWNRQLLESEEILSFDSFVSKSSSLNEEDGESESGEISADLKPSQATGPAKVAIYRVTEREYANPEYRGKYETGDFTSFVVNPEDWKVKDGTSIEVYPDTDEILDNSIKGIYTYKKDEEEGEDKSGETKTFVTTRDDEEKDKKSKEEDEEEGKKISDDYYITADPDDIKIKQRERSTSVRDASLSGGINLFDEFLTPRQKEILGIDKWKTITFAKEFYDKRGDIIEVKLKNKYAPLGDKSRKYRVVDGESFEIAKKFVEDTKERIKYE